MRDNEPATFPLTDSEIAYHAQCLITALRFDLQHNKGTFNNFDLAWMNLLVAATRKPPRAMAFKLPVSNRLSPKRLPLKDSPIERTVKSAFEALAASKRAERKHDYDYHPGDHLANLLQVCGFTPKMIAKAARKYGVSFAGPKGGKGKLSNMTPDYLTDELVNYIRLRREDGEYNLPSLDDFRDSYLGDNTATARSIARHLKNKYHMKWSEILARAEIHLQPTSRQNITKKVN